MNEPQKAESLQLDSLKTYVDEGWAMLADDTVVELAKCYARIGDTQK